MTDTAEQAREVAFGSAQRQKVVALDGTIINKAGIITGGFNSGLEARAGQWDQGALEGMKQARAWPGGGDCGLLPLCCGVL